MMMETVPSGTILHGRYRIERVLGSGGFGHVYQAVDLKTNQPYAVKEYLVTGASGQAQLQHEARVLNQLHHPNLPAFHEAFNERGRYYVVLSYIEGSDLTDLIRVARQRNEAIPLARIMGWILSICDAVAFLHSQQPTIIHRDIKPDNIRIMPNGTALLVDLGNAKAVADGARTLFFIRHQGTPGYAPLEQYPGGTGTDARSDVYALGGTLYFALTAHEPPSVSTRNQSLQQGQPDLPSLQEQLANNPPPSSADLNAERQFRLGVTKPSKPTPRHSRHLAQLGTLPPELLDQLNRIIKRAMAMKPKERYQSVADLSNDLKRVVAALPAATPAQTAPARPIDPHSTQPDLPGIYEAVQAAKEQVAKENTERASPTSKDAPVAPAAQPSSTPTPTNECPRCHAPLIPQAAFCPRCGLSLSTQANAASTPPTAPNPNIDTRNPQNQAVVRDVSAEETMRIPPQVRGTANTPKTFTPTPPMSAPSTSTSQNRSRPQADSPARSTTSAVTKAPPAPFLPNVSTTSAASQAPAAQMSTPPQARGFSIQLRIIIALIVVLVVLLAILVLFILNQGHIFQSGLHKQWYFIEAQVSAYERNISLGITSSVTPAAVGIWTRCPGVPPAAGLT